MPGLEGFDINVVEQLAINPDRENETVNGRTPASTVPQEV